jgi:cell division protein FtsQ
MFHGLYQGDALGARRRRGRRWRRSTLAALAVVLAAGSLMALSVETAELVADSTWLQVRSVELGGLCLLDPADVHSWLGAVPGRSLLEIDPGRLARQLELHPRIAAAHVSRGLDRRLHVEVVERRPVALLLAGVLVELDRDGVVLAPLEETGLPDLPVLTGVTNLPLVPGERLQGPVVEQVISALATFADQQPELLEIFAEVDLSEAPVLHVRIIGGDIVVRLHVDDFRPARLEGLDGVLADLERRGHRRIMVDLRYEGQLVVRELSQGDAPAGQHTGQEGGS